MFFKFIADKIILKTKILFDFLSVSTYFSALHSLKFFSLILRENAFRLVSGKFRKYSSESTPLNFTSGMFRKRIFFNVREIPFRFQLIY